MRRGTITWAVWHCWDINTAAEALFHSIERVSGNFLIKDKERSTFQMFKLDLEKADEPEIKLPTSVGSSQKQESSRKTSTSALLIMLKPLTGWIQ